jgi:hypothetical protein
VAGRRGGFYSLDDSRGSFSSFDALATPPDGIMMDAMVKAVAAVSICAFITRINYDSLDAARSQPVADRAFSFDVRVSCDDDYDMAKLTPADLAVVEKAVEDSFNRIYLGQYGDYLSYVGWKGSKVTPESSRDGHIANLFRATMVRFRSRQIGPEALASNENGLLAVAIHRSTLEESPLRNLSWLKSCTWTGSSPSRSCWHPSMWTGRRVISTSSILATSAFALVIQRVRFRLHSQHHPSSRLERGDKSIERNQTSKTAC